MGILRILAKHLLYSGDDGREWKKKLRTQIQLYFGIVGNIEENLLMMASLSAREKFKITINNKSEKKFLSYLLWRRRWWNLYDDTLNYIFYHIS